MPDDLVVEPIYSDFITLQNFLIEKGEASLKIYVDTNIKKNILLSAASYFEVKFCEHILSYIEEVSNSNTPLKEFVNTQALKRKFHTLFDWDKNNANKFFAFWGQDFKKFMEKTINEDANLESSISDFMEIGRERNRLVHMNFGNYSLEKTTDELFNAYRSALYFVEEFPKLLRKYIGETKSE